MALFVPDDSPLLFYRKIAELGRDMLVSGGRLAFVHIKKQKESDVGAL